MAIRNWNQEWRSANANRAYPLTADASRYDVTQTFRLPNDFIIGLKLSVAIVHTVDIAKFTIKRIDASSNGFVVVIGYDDGSTIVTVASASIPRSTHEDNTVYRLGGIGNFVDVDGSVLIGSFDNIDLQPAGVWNFDLDGGRLEPDAILPQIHGVTSIAAQNGSSVSDRFYGDIILKAGRNCRITPVQEVGEDPEFVFDAIEGEGLNDICVCEGDIAEAPAIRRINGVPGTPEGDFTLLGNNCLEWEAIDNGLKANDTCSEPCCGCTELEAITEALEGLGQTAASLELLATNLEARVTQTDQVILGSRLGDRGCTTCE